jgi:hypothetical protein
VGATSQREPKQLKRSDQTIVNPRNVPIISTAGLAGGVPDISPLSRLAGHGMGKNRDVPQRFASPQQDKQKVGSIRNVRLRPLPIIRNPNIRLGAQAHQQRTRSGRSTKVNRLRLPRVSAHGIYDTNDPQSYVAPVRRRWAASQADELWYQWRMVEAEKRRRT